ncbi:MAG: methyltransferase domain-containing protein [Phycisphaera sp.]|nr:methyltransferase domain-containing protein [Phycisphaera sp.]
MKYDRHQLYELSVQQPVVLLDFLEDVCDDVMDREPVVLREDFCGTAYLSSMWVRSDEGRKAVGVDFDAKVLRWAERHNRKPLAGDAGRLKLVEADVLRCGAKADIVAALNFSHFIFKTRDELLRYFRHARRCVKPGGVMLLDAYGGPGAMAACEDVRRFGDFDYVWEQKPIDPLTNRVVNYIHFRFPDGTRMDRAFRYDWRLWSVVELRELLVEAGFADVLVWFETEEGFDAELDTSDMEAWVTYLVAVT